MVMGQVQKVIDNFSKLDDFVDFNDFLLYFRFVLFCKKESDEITFQASAFPLGAHAE